MRRRRQQGFRPGTHSNLKTQAAAYLRFCARYGLRDTHPSPRVLCWYLESLTASIRSPQTIRNYLSGFRAWHLRVAGAPHAIDSPQVLQMLRALDRTLPHSPSPKHPLDSSALMLLLATPALQGHEALPLKVGILLGYYGFLRQSNLAPRSATAFDPSRDTCRGDLVIAPPGLLLTLKWSKTIQRGHRTHTIPIPARPGHPLCPLRPYQDLLRITPTLSPQDPLLQHTSPPHAPPRARVLTSLQLAAGLRRALQQAGLDPALYSLHSLRAGGATDAYCAGAPPQDIQRHGDWASSCFWGYVAGPSPPSATVPRLLGSI